jgi:hypothetical protein
MPLSSKLRAIGSTISSNGFCARTAVSSSSRAAASGVVPWRFAVSAMDRIRILYFDD